MLAVLLILQSLLVSSMPADCQNWLVPGDLTMTVKGEELSLPVLQSGGTPAQGIYPSGNTLAMNHGRRCYIGKSGCPEKFAPDVYYGLPLLGNTFSFKVNLSKVSCACNAAVYFVALPAYDAQQNPDPGNGDEYYCGASSKEEVCPEIDIIEANSHALQVTPHECNAPTGKHYNVCDHFGCSRNPYKINHDSYGPGRNYTINTLEPFLVSSTFGEEAGMLSRMETNLIQGEKTFQIVHDDDGCGASYLESISTAIQNGMTLTVSYWGQTAQWMDWLDIPPCSDDADCDMTQQVVFSDFRIDQN